MSIGLLAATGSTVPDVSVGRLLMQMVIAVGVVGGGIWLFGKFIQRRKQGALRAGGRSATHGLTVLSRTSLGKDHHLAVVSWGGREVLIGVSGSSIALIADSKDADVVDDTKVEPLHLMNFDEAPRSPTASSSPSGRPSFLEALRTATLRS